MAFRSHLHRPRHVHARTSPRVPVSERRLVFLRVIVVAFMAAIGWRLFALQALNGDFYQDLAASQRGRYANLRPDRGVIYAQDPKAPDGRFPVAVNKTLATVYADTRELRDPAAAANQLAGLLATDASALFEKLSKKGDPYVPLKAKVPDDLTDQIRALEIRGIGFAKEPYRFYPEQSVFSQVVGFFGSSGDGDRVGRYGVEGRWDRELYGTAATVATDGDALGGIMPTGGRFVAAMDGDDLVLTIDRNVQYAVCEKLRLAVEKHSADGGSAVALNPKTGAIMALCNVPDFNPNDVSAVKDFNVFNNNGIFSPYEPGSIFKAVTMAAGVDDGKVGPHSTYVDEGSIKIGPFTIRNSDNKAHGLQTMTQVLDESLNTGMIHVAFAVGPDRFRDYVEKFGFGAPLGIDLDTESGGDVSSLSKKGDIWTATASFGQGVTVTPLQIAAAYGAIANGGKLMRPYVVERQEHADGTVTRTEPAVIRQVITKRAAALVSGMLVSVVENGHGKKAAVPGYYVAGKTGTAQVPNPNGGGYLEGVTIGSFVGFAPVDNPAFVLAVKLDHPKDVQWAESSAGPLFGDIARFLLQYLQIPPERPL